MSGKYCREYKLQSIITNRFQKSLRANVGQKKEKSELTAVCNMDLLAPEYEHTSNILHPHKHINLLLNT